MEKSHLNCFLLSSENTSSLPLGMATRSAKRKRAARAAPTQSTENIIPILSKPSLRSWKRSSPSPSPPSHPGSTVPSARAADEGS